MENVMKNIQWKPLIRNLIFSLATGSVSTMLSGNLMEKYESIYKPPLSPPAWGFPVVWFIWYIMMGIAAYLIYVSENANAKAALKLYAAQLALSAIWPILFFRFELYLLAFTWLLLLWYLVFLTHIEFRKIHPYAGKLLLPYLIWLFFAGYLNLATAVYYKM
ncbi:TspO/MBR family protein [Novisyntrophococcus fermenticellae]|uniref:TspO/MBR family protein n=1 Tax=Novisyntrophococcus fermenticellae TaxID=2068655 RepID=UPI001E53561D|nr:TspO/MBR family protein [Novisyntrophococcus fermenticellae]